MSRDVGPAGRRYYLSQTVPIVTIWEHDDEKDWDILPDPVELAKP
jgi:hypothetical protein